MLVHNCPALAYLLRCLSSVTSTLTGLRLEGETSFPLSGGRNGGMEVSEARRLKALEAENAKLKKMLAEHILDVVTLKEVLGKNF